MTKTGQPYADVRETHSGVVVLLGDLAYKLKKPIVLPFLDFSTPARRREACEREVTLNRRLAPDVYLGVAALETPNGVAEPMVLMRRMPDERRLSRVIDTPTGPEEVRAIARLMAQFHAQADRGRQISAAGGRERVRARWRRNLDEAAALPSGPLGSDLLDAIRARVETYLAGRSPLFDERVEQEKVIDGHGDLLADDIFCLADGPRVLDCLEFDDRLRYVDQIDDIACLAMDLLRLGHADAAAQLVHWYREFSADQPPQSLVHHYIAYRAFMRAKVTAVREQDPTASLHSPSTEDAVELGTLALSHLDTAAVRLVLIGGAPGTGKSTLAGFLSRRLGMTTISSDEVRKELAGLSSESNAPAAFSEGIYTAEWTGRTYAEILHRARLLLAFGESVIIDASWSDQRQRDAAERLAHDASAELVQLCCEVPVRIAAERIGERRGVSDADEGIALLMRNAAAPWPDSVRIDNTRALADAVDDAAAAVLSGSGSTNTGP